MAPPSSVPSIQANAPAFAFSAAPVQRASVGSRIGALAVAAGAAAILAIASSLTPAPQGHATHLALGLPPCGWVVSFGRPCPTCGMTTAFAHVADGQIWAAMVAQPFGALLACITGVAGWGALHVAATGSMIGAAAARFFTRRVIAYLVALFIASWVYKIATFTMQ